MKYSFIIEKLENNEAILKDASGLLVRWPKNKLPDGAKEKDEIVFHVGAAVENENLAKDILNEILSAE